MKMLVYSCFLFLPTILCSCGSFGRIPAPEQIAQVQTNRTTDEQALAILGKPESVEEENGRTLYGWSKIELASSEGQVHLEEYQILADSSGVVRKTNYSRGTLQKEGYMITKSSVVGAVREPSVALLPVGISGADAERRLGRPLSRTLRVDGGLDRTWVTSVRNVSAVTNVRPKQVIGHFSSGTDRLVYAETKR